MVGELEVAIVASVASLIVAIIAILGYHANRKQIQMAGEQIAMSRKQTVAALEQLEMARKQLRVNEEKLETSQRQLKVHQENLKLIEKAVQAVMAIADSQRKQVEALANQVDAAGVLKRTEEGVRQEIVALQKQRANWSILAGVAKALGWAYDRGLIGRSELDDEDEG